MVTFVDDWWIVIVLALSVIEVFLLGRFLSPRVSQLAGSKSSRSPGNP
jgi:hypothetical protein